MALPCRGNQSEQDIHMKISIITLFIIVFTASVFAQDSLRYKFSYNTLLKEKIQDYNDNDQQAILSGYFQNNPDGKKSVAKALFLSLILPGAGEYYVGETGYTKFFLGMEILGWSSIVFNRHYYSSLQKDYMAYARLHAGIDKKNKDDQYWIDVGKHDDIYSYNSTRVNQRRIEELYDENKNNYWQWDSRKNRYTYDAKRLNSVSIKDREIYMTIGILVNHLVSAVNAVRLARRHNKNLAQSSFQYKFVFDTQVPDNNYLGLVLTKSF
jgi:hypothetical protein